MDILIKKNTAEEYYNSSYKLYIARQYPEAIYLCRLALKRDPRFRPPYLRLGNMFAILQRYDEAEGYFNRYLYYCLEAEHQMDIARAYNAIGYLQSQKNEISESLRYYYMSLDIVKNMKKPLEISRCYNNIALAHRINKDFEKAYYFYQKAISEIKQLNAMDRLAYYYFNISMLYKEQEKFFKAMWYLRKFKKLNKILKKKGTYLLPSEAHQVLE